jgi:hypothetical protein
MFLVVLIFASVRMKTYFQQKSPTAAVRRLATAFFGLSPRTPRFAMQLAFANSSGLPRAFGLVAGALVVLREAPTMHHLKPSA